MQALSFSQAHLRALTGLLFLVLLSFFVSREAGAKRAVLCWILEASKNLEGHICYGGLGPKRPIELIEAALGGAGGAFLTWGFGAAADDAPRASASS